MRILKFFGTSVIATGVDFLIYAGLVQITSPVVANVFSASAGLITNFFLQKSYVFNRSNSLKRSFILSLVFSLLGLGLGTVFIYLFTTFTPLAHQPVIAKVITTAIIFFYNYFTKKIAFGHKDTETSGATSC
ncbi:GtrA family protein [Desulfosediminicola sp.]|uniref:GtrA family protein n=1 Tax=Desulfosediminicola sp. TaxID=2886825 RepID=UPI003AF308A2